MHKGLHLGLGLGTYGLGLGTYGLGLGTYGLGLGTYGLGLNILALTTSLNLGTVAPVRQNIYVLPCMSS